MASPEPTRFPLQDFTPMHRSLEWRLSPFWWEARAQDAFHGGDVPYLVTSDGRLADQAARVFLAAAAGMPAEGTLWILEAGAGSGLFARLFLLALRDLCAAEGVDVYDRVRYVVADASPGMIRKLTESALLEEFGEQVRLVVAPLPGVDDALAGCGLDPAARWSMVAVNYVLDSLPATILRRRDGRLEELRLRTFLHEDGVWYSQTGMEHTDILELVRKGDTESLWKLLPLLHHLRMDARFETVDPAALPDPARVPDADGAFAHGFGALAALDEFTRRLAPGGFVLVNDYAFEGAGDPPVAEYQRFGGSAALGLNFAQIDRAMAAAGLASHAPEHPDATLPARMIGADIAPAAVELFRAIFGTETRDKLKQPLEQIAEHTEAGRMQEALTLWQGLLDDHPRNWHVREQAAVFLTHQAGLHETAIEVAREALRLHPCASLLWNVLGDAFLHLKDTRSAVECYETSIRLHPGEVRARLNLATLMNLRGHPAEALSLVNAALQHDVRLDYSEDLLVRQREASQLLMEMRKQEAARVQDRVRHLPD